MNASEIRADMVAELRAAADGYQSLGARNMQLAGTCRSLAAQLRAQSDQIEESARADARPTEATINPQPSTFFSQSPNAAGRADESTAEPVVFKLNAADSSSAATLNMERAA